MAEPEWQSAATRLGLLLMSGGGARGVYQAQLPLQLAASLDLGCVATVAPAARQRTLGDGFALNELQVTEGEGLWVCGCGVCLGRCVTHVCSRLFAVFVLRHTLACRLVWCMMQELLGCRRDS